MTTRRVRAELVMHKYIDPHCFIKKGCYEALIDAMIEFADKELKQEK